MANSITADKQLIMLGSLLDSFISECEAAKQDLACIHNIPVEKIDLFPDHPYYVDNDEDMANLVRSIKAIGQISPGITRVKADGRYELLSGHRRLWACRLAGIKAFRCEVLDLSDEDALVYMIEANRQRQKLLSGEKSQVYRLKREELNGRQNISDIRIDARDNTDQIRLYIRLGYLIPEILDLVDEGIIALRPAASISFLSEGLQRYLLENMEYEQKTPSYSQTLRMKQLFQEGVLTRDKIIDIMMEEKPNQRERVVLHGEKILAKLPRDIPAKEQEEYIARALEFYEKHGRQ
jgi:ParB family chromosome partitioning protein